MADRALQDVVRDIQRLFPPIMRHLEEQAQYEVTGLDVTPAQMDALLVLYEPSSMPMGELASQLGLTESAATRLVDRLVKMNLVRRDRDETDRRVVRVRLSPYGRQLAELVFERREARFQRVLSRLSKADQDSLIRGLTALLKVFQDLEETDTWADDAFSGRA